MRLPTGSKHSGFTVPTVPSGRSCAATWHGSTMRRSGGASSMARSPRLLRTRHSREPPRACCRPSRGTMAVGPHGRTQSSERRGGAGRRSSIPCVWHSPGGSAAPNSPSSSLSSAVQRLRLDFLARRRKACYRWLKPTIATDGGKSVPRGTLRSSAAMTFATQVLEYTLTKEDMLHYSRYTGLHPRFSGARRRWSRIYLTYVALLAFLAIVMSQWWVQGSFTRLTNILIAV